MFFDIFHLSDGSPAVPPLIYSIIDVPVMTKMILMMKNIISMMTLKMKVIMTMVMFLMKFIINPQKLVMKIGTRSVKIKNVYNFK